MEPELRSRSGLSRKALLINEILTEPSLYKVLGVTSRATESELRRHYLDRSKIVHPDKLPAHPDSTEAFQRLSHAYEILRKPSLRAHYDRESKSWNGEHREFYPGETSFISGDQTFRGAVVSILNEFLNGDFGLVRKLLEALNKQYPSLVNEEVIVAIERAFGRIRELILTTRTYALLISIELGRIHRVQKKLLSLGYFDVIGRVRLTMQLVRVTLAVPVRVDRALQRKEEREWRAKQAGWTAVGVKEHGNNGAYLLNEKVSRVLAFIAGDKMEDEEEDRDWMGRFWGEPARAA
ncbi:hypothetical protein DFP73DRAFT_37977 [Morchella snyderi]|nr:hypothetical protein DFP73DRAFT_37977 [Morchella snyderi]